MSRTQFNLSLFAVIFMFMSACGAAPTETYQDNNLSITYDSSWHKVSDFSAIQGSGIETENLLFALLREVAGDIIVVTLTYDQIDSGTVLAEYIDEQRNYAVSVNGYTEIEKEKMTVNGKTSEWHVFQGRDGSVAMIEYIQTYAASDIVGYTLTASKRGEFTAEERAELKTVLQSFSLKQE